MQLLTVICVLAAFNGGGGVTRTQDLTKFWTDDYKVFEQIYGKTSDKDLYGAVLPTASPSAYGVDISKLIQNQQELKNREKLLRDLNLKDIDTSESDLVDSYSYGDQYSNLLTKQSLNNYALKDPNPSKQMKFVGVPDYKQITQQNDPETYKYLKHLEQLQQEKEQNIILTEENLAKYFKPYYTIAKNPKETEAYKSIQDILEAHEANKGKTYTQNVEQEDVKVETVKEVTEEPEVVRNRRKKNNPMFTTVRSRCFGRCRKRIRLRMRPYLRRIKKTIYTDE